MERSIAGTKKRSNDEHHYLIKIRNKQHTILVFHKIWKKYNEIQSTKNKIDVNNRKIKKIIRPLRYGNIKCGTHAEEEASRKE